MSTVEEFLEGLGLGRYVSAFQEAGYDDLDVVLSVEYPSEELDRSEFDDALDVLSYYADRHYDELRALIA